MDCAIYTICNVAYLPRALVLAESVWNNSGGKVEIVIFDGKRDLEVDSNYGHITWLEDYDVPMYKQLAFKYDILEFATALRPWFAHYFLQNNDTVIYFDPDMMVYNSLDSVLNDLKRYPIILTPHYTKPHDYDHADSDLSMMRFGSFNLGFFAIKKTNESVEFLLWLYHRCFHLCFAESQFGLSTDQKWVSIAPCFFPNIHISFNLGYNVAYWNMHERTVSKIDGKYYINSEYPLVFFHFSSFDELHPDNLSKNSSCSQIREQRKDLIEISNEYSSLLNKYELKNTDRKYQFDYFSNGKPIAPTLRRAYASIINELPEHDPFDATGIVYKFAKHNHLLVKHQPVYKSHSFNDINQYKTKFKIITLLMRCVLRYLGPYQFMNFSRLLVYLSSYRQFRALWKFKLYNNKK